VVTQLNFDAVLVCLDRLAAEAEISCDSTGTNSSSDQAEDVEFTIRQTAGQSPVRPRRSHKVVNRKECHARAHVELAGKDRFNAADELFARAAFHQVAARPSVQNSLSVNFLRLLRDHENARSPKTPGKFLDEQHAITSLSEGVNEEEVWMVPPHDVCHIFSVVRVIAQLESVVPADYRFDTLTTDRVGIDYKQPRTGCVQGSSGQFRHWR